MVKPKKHLGQHFLKDLSVSKNIAQAIRLHGNYSQLAEIGPGTGALTQFLLELPVELKTFEIDRESVDYLHQNYPGLEVINKDFLRVDLSSIFEDQFGVCGNFPYNISSQILFKVLDVKRLVPEVIGMFQKEVAERICAKEGNKTYGILSVLIQAYYEAEYLFTVDENVFNPPPKVKSGVIRLKRKEIPPACTYKDLHRLVKAAFGQRRKTLRNALNSLQRNIPEEFSSLRAEQLSVKDFIRLCGILYS